MKLQFIKANVNGLKAMVIGALLAVAMPVSAFAASSTVYDATPAVLPPNVASLGYEATSTSEFGDYVHLAGTDRTLEQVTVTMSNWALFSDYSTDPRYSADSANWPLYIDLNVYSNHLDENGVPDTLLATKSELVQVPWRPAADPTCPGGTAWRASDTLCYNGIAFNANFDMSSLGVTLPNNVIVGVAYNTQHYGADPVGMAGPYNSLNVGIPTGQTASVGTDDNTDAVFWDTIYPGYTAGLKQDTGWAPNGTVAFKITASTAMPTNKDQCKKDGWRNFGSTFKNQGDCVSFVANKGKNT